MNLRPILWVPPLLGLAACSFLNRDEEPTIKSLEGRTVPVERGAAIAGGRQKAIIGYEAFLGSAPDHELRPEAMRRLGDLLMQDTEERQLAGDAAPARAPVIKPTAADYRNAIGWYRDLLRMYPDYAGNDRVMYQLAKAYEQSGDLPRSLEVLDRLVAAYPGTRSARPNPGSRMTLTGARPPARLWTSYAVISECPLPSR